MRYFFHINAPDHAIQDHEGSELPNWEAVRHEAVESARFLLANGVRRGRAPDTTAFQIADETGAIVLRFPFRDAIA